MNKLSRIKPAIDKLIAETPRWKCFCCQDTGFVIRQELVIEGFCDGLPPDASPPSDYALLCKYCDMQYSLGHLAVDDRLTAAQCKEIHQARLNDWLATVKSFSDRFVPRPVSNPSTERTKSFAAIAEVLSN